MMGCGRRFDRDSAVTTVRAASSGGGCVRQMSTPRGRQCRLPQRPSCAAGKKQRSPSSWQKQASATLPGLRPSNVNLVTRQAEAPEATLAQLLPLDGEVLQNYVARVETLSRWLRSGASSQASCSREARSSVRAVPHRGQVSPPLDGTRVGIARKGRRRHWC